MTIIRYPRRFDVNFLRPIQELEEMRRRMDRLFEDVFDRHPFGMLSSGVFPSINMSQDDANIYVRAELPGLKPEDLEISMERNTLDIRGERKAEDAQGVSYHRRERQGGRFHKAVGLPYEVNPEGVTSELKNGILTIVLPKAESAKPKRIEVKTS